MGSSWWPVSVEKPGKVAGEPRWDGRNYFLGGPENRTQDYHFKCQFEKNGGLAVFLTAKPSVPLRRSGLALKVTQA